MTKYQNEFPCKPMQSRPAFDKDWNVTIFEGLYFSTRLKLRCIGVVPSVLSNSICAKLFCIVTKHNFLPLVTELKSMEEFNRTASVVATNIQKLVQNVSSMQRMLVHVESQVAFSNLFSWL